MWHAGEARGHTVARRQRRKLRFTTSKVTVSCDEKSIAFFMSKGDEG